MDVKWSTSDQDFRDEVRDFLANNLTPEIRRAGRLMTSVYADHDASMAWQKILHERGWAAPAWPVEHGGCAWSLTQHYIFSRESTLAGAPSLSPMASAWWPTPSSNSARRHRRTTSFPES
ncbi:alkylation response protein AidB-like acyl-CoA dehydrogenase [Mycobacterium frederiksbergense]|uniref:Alkylation response protein AidB-like acyl-CoA dehydrogenase n=1 Tax=Mycolicibacterium frederiksbergense TaxID=117567 RepID=A0ABT6L4A3_9MYCO|nr:alkylation response protein AidB-like acyl-CoA dehydrogenase [Mycolicibacterium frederiksbergense]